MHFSHWFRRSRPRTTSYRPRVEVMEERLVPAAYRSFAPVPAPATHFLVVVPKDVVKGQTFNVTVEALVAAPKRGWVVVDMKKDWKKVFAFDK